MQTTPEAAVAVAEERVGAGGARPGGVIHGSLSCSKVMLSMLGLSPKLIGLTTWRALGPVGAEGDEGALVADDMSAFRELLIELFTGTLRAIDSSGKSERQQQEEGLKNGGGKGGAAGGSRGEVEAVEEVQQIKQAATAAVTASSARTLVFDDRGGAWPVQLTAQLSLLLLATFPQSMREVLGE